MSRLLLVSLVSASCGRVAFDPLMAGDGGDAGVRPGVFVQRREVAMDVNVQTFAIEPIDTSRTMVLCDYRTADSSVAKQPMCELIDATTVRVTTGIADPEVIVLVQLVQLPEGSVVQRGVYNMGSGEMVATIPASFDSTRAFPLISRRTMLDTAGLDARFLLGAILASGTTLQLARDAVGNTLQVAWQIVEPLGARVLQGNSGLGAGTFFTGSSGVALDIDRTFPVQSVSADGSEETCYLVRTELTASSTGSAFDALSIREGTTCTVEHDLVFVEQPGVSVQRGATPFTTESAISVTFGRPVDPTRTMAILSVSGGRVGQFADLDDSLVTGEVQSGGIVLARNPISPTDVASVAAWTVVEWK